MAGVAGTRRRASSSTASTSAAAATAQTFCVNPLKNLGQTCYMAVGLQSAFSVTSLKTYIEDSKSQEEGVIALKQLLSGQERSPKKFLQAIQRLDAEKWAKEKKKKKRRRRKKKTDDEFYRVKNANKADHCTVVFKFFLPLLFPTFEVDYPMYDVMIEDVATGQSVSETFKQNLILDIQDGSLMKLDSVPFVIYLQVDLTLYVNKTNTDGTETRLPTRSKNNNLCVTFEEELRFTKNQIVNTDKDLLYKLVAIIEHRGKYLNTKAHYVAYVRRFDGSHEKWYLTDDEKEPREVSKEQVMKFQKPELLIYELHV